MQHKKSFASILILVGFIFCSCNKNTIDHAEKKQEQANKPVELSKFQLSEQMFKNIPLNPNGFRDMNNVEIQERIPTTTINGEPVKDYYGEGFTAIGNNFRIIFSKSEQGYIIQKVELAGPCFLDFWDDYWNIDKEQLIESQGEPSYKGKEHITYSNELFLVSVYFTNSKVTKVVIARQL